MSQHQPSPHLITPTWAITVPCPYCDGESELVRRIVVITGRAELRIFECYDCGMESAMALGKAHSHSDAA